ncbi:MAG: hypothetical protein OXK80_05880 [Bdellovibrionales bacterium]|nr:hypothetical protein [Bdellovibrionales bacterium]
MELDSFCERETLPQEFSIANIGMKSLLNSKLYGQNRTTAIDADCDVSGTSTPANLRPSGCSASTQGACTSCSAGAFTPYLAARSNAPGKENFIGFGADATTNGCGTAISENLHYVSDANPTTETQKCDMGIVRYELGVVGHISGATWYGVSVNNEGVVSSEDEDSASAVLTGCV